MSMIWEEAIEELERLLRHWDDLENGKRCFWNYDKEAIALALSALSVLCPSSREQVENVWMGKWVHDPETGYEHCDKCSHTISLDNYLNRKPPLFCEMCGDAKTDEAVDMMLEKWKEAINND